MNTQNQQPLRLITIGISHYCEKVRWALDWLEIDYIEESHAPPFHRKYTTEYGGLTVPVLVVGERAFTDSTEILQYLDTITPAEKSLYPQAPQLRRQVEELEELFDTKLGIASRSVGYYYAMQKPLVVLKAWVATVPWWEKIGAAIAFPVIFLLIKRKFKITEANQEKASKTIREVFNLVSERLQTGQQYLVSDRLTVADLSFAALASPVLRPHNHPVYSADLSQLPPAMGMLVQELRETAAGQLVLQLYQTKRNSS
jgi:glutathione S-transferase